MQEWVVPILVDSAKSVGLALRGAKLVLAISGGADSVGMLRAFYDARQALKLGELLVVHVDHGLRGAASAEDALWVENLCTTLDLAYRLERLPHWDGQGSVEEWARIWRYQVLLQAKKEWRAQAVCTAHHAGDQVETLVLRQRRGTGLSGLLGIKEWREDGIWRPFLRLWPQTLRQLAEPWGWREDASNHDISLDRNLVRKRILPELRRQWPLVDAALLHLCQRWAELGANTAWLQAMEPCLVPQEQWPKPLQHWWSGQLLAIRLDQVKRIFAHGIAGELFRLWCGTKGWGWPKGAADEGAWRVLSGQGVRTSLPGLVMERSGTIVWVFRRATAPPSIPIMYLLPSQPNGSEVTNGSSTDEGLQAFVGYGSAEERDSSNPTIRFPLLGDVFVSPDLRRRHRKLTRVLQEAGIPASLRSHIPVVAYQHQVLWIPGLGVSGNFQVRATNQTVQKLSLECPKKSRNP